MYKIDHNLEQYLTENSTRLDPVLEELIRVTHLKTFNPRMISGATQGKFLEFLCKMQNPLRILEIGTFTGFSTICMAKAISSSAKIDTIEINDELRDIIVDFLNKAGVSNKVNLHFGDANQIIPTLKNSYDLVFIDGDKRDYPNYYQLIFPLVKNGGFIIADNVLWNGKVLDQKFIDDQTVAIRKFNNIVQNDPLVDNILLPLRDGLMLIHKY